MPDPATGQQVNVGVTLSSSEGVVPLGIPNVPGKDFKDIEAYTVRIGNAMFTVYTASLERGEFGDTIKTVGVYPGFETRLGG